MQVKEAAAEEQKIKGQKIKEQTVKAKEAQTLMSAIWKERTVYEQSDPTQHRLSEIGSRVLQGYHIASQHYPTYRRIVEQVSLIRPEFQGFVYEGVGMALAEKGFRLKVGLSPVETFATEFARQFHNWIYVGVGLMFSQAKINPRPLLLTLSQERRWLVIDGYAYHQGVFHWKQLLNEQTQPEAINPEDAFVFDQGLGRSLWFVDAGKVSELQQTVERFRESRRRDLWSGLGYACAYTGGTSELTLRSLVIAANTYQPQLLAGAMFANKARVASECPAEWTSLTYQTWQTIIRESMPKVSQSSNPQVNGSQRDYSQAGSSQTWDHYRAAITHHTAG